MLARSHRLSGKPTSAMITTSHSVSLTRYSRSSEVADQWHALHSVVPGGGDVDEAAEPQEAVDVVDRVVPDGHDHGDG
ncbi:MAG TPA: hypothetical protein VK453_08245 [Micromonosporaceae bacterium]|nr:hypothetical protein [Micromonosporaceae bacterium]